jgi:N-acyl-D-aspartate/D-glutamate deacylase
MLDHLLKGGTVVDGTGAPGRVADVGIRDGRIVAVGDVDEPARETLDATGLIVSPGVIDPHTHFDAQLFWDPYGSPSSAHGVTSVIGGNCSFALAPLRAEDADYTRRMMAKVEGMPLEALEQGIPWNWESFGEFLDAMDGRLAMNAGFLAGHSAIRRYVLGTEANLRSSTADEVEVIRQTLAQALEQGALGFSVDISSAHSDGDGRPIPARPADSSEILALCEETGRHPGTTLAGIFDGGSDGWSPEEIELLSAMSATANRPLNWNVLVVDAKAPDRLGRQMALSRHARTVGGRVIALVMPTIVPMNMSFGNYCALFLIPGWGPIMKQDKDARIAALRDPANRRMMVEKANSDEAGMFRRLADFGGYIIGDTFSAANEGLSGRVVRDIAAERNADPFDTLVDIVIADDLRTVLWPSAPDDDDAHWAIRRQLMDDPDVLLAGSDAGAHLDRMCGGTYATEFYADTIRGRKFVSIERAVHHLTGAPAALFGLTGRGVVAEGAHADLFVFDPATVGAAPVRLAHDLPGGSARMTADSTGVVGVWVNGVRIIADGQPTGALPGRTLRSGRDTTTVAAQG